MNALLIWQRRRTNGREKLNHGYLPPQQGRLNTCYKTLLEQFVALILHSLLVINFQHNSTHSRNVTEHFQHTLSRQTSNYNQDTKQNAICKAICHSLLKPNDLAFVSLWSGNSNDRSCISVLQRYSEITKQLLGINLQLGSSVCNDMETKHFSFR
jgi:hypothetical protein